MKLDCDRIVQETQALLKLNHDVNLQDATAQELHDSLGQAVMMAIHENWSRSKEKRGDQPPRLLFLGGISRWPNGLQQPL